LVKIVRVHLIRVQTLATELVNWNWSGKLASNV